MPITQDRMIALVDAALDYQQGLETLCNYIKRSVAKIERKEMAVENFLIEINTFADVTNSLGDPGHTMKTVGMESRHWRLAKKKNDRDRRRAREKRLAQGHIPLAHSTAPKSLDHITRPHKSNKLQIAGLAPRPRDYMGTSAQTLRPEVDQEAKDRIDMSLEAQSVRDLAPGAKSQIDLEVERLAKKQEKMEKKDDDLGDVGEDENGD